MAGNHVALFEACRSCQGSRLAPPDERIHETLPDNAVGVKRRHRAGRVPCPDCQGAGYLRAPLREASVQDLERDYQVALEVLQELVDQFALSDLEAVSYLSDPLLRALNMKAESVLDRARGAGRGEPERHGRRR